MPPRLEQEPDCIIVASERKKTRLLHQSSVSNFIVIFAYDIVSATSTLLHENRAENALHGCGNKTTDNAEE